MKALLYSGLSELSVQEVQRPTLRPGEVLVRTSYTGICGTDLLIWHDKHSRATPPVVLGHEFSGTVEAAPQNSTFTEGDRVVVEPLLTCGKCSSCTSGSYNACPDLKIIGVDVDGSLATVVAVPENRVHRVPASLDLRDAAFTEPLAVVCHLFRRIGNFAPGETVFVSGGGPIGLLAGSLALTRGANVVVAELSPFRIDLGRQLGFEMIDPTATDLHARLGEITDGEGFNVGIEATGVPAAFASCVKAAAVGARIGIVGLPKSSPALDVNQLIAKELTLIGSRVYTAQDFEMALDLLNTRTIDASVHISNIVAIDEVIPLGFQAIDRGDPVLKVLVDQRRE